VGGGDAQPHQLQQLRIEAPALGDGLEEGHEPLQQRRPVGHRAEEGGVAVPVGGLPEQIVHLGVVGLAQEHRVDNRRPATVVARVPSRPPPTPDPAKLSVPGPLCPL
jgi:hypothetical protein